jgi:hypothetical protein
MRLVPLLAPLGGGPLRARPSCDCPPPPGTHLHAARPPSPAPQPRADPRPRPSSPPPPAPLPPTPTPTSTPAFSCTNHSASASVSRPSASVLFTSTVLPLAAVRMSPGRRPLADTMFSQDAMTKWTWVAGSFEFGRPLKMESVFVGRGRTRPLAGPRLCSSSCDAHACHGAPCTHLDAVGLRVGQDARRAERRRAAAHVKLWKVRWRWGWGVGG